MKALKRRWLGLLVVGIVLPASTPPMALADDVNRGIEDHLTLKEQKVDLECRRHSVMTGVNGEVLFAIEECPVCYPGNLQLRETRRRGIHAREPCLMGLHAEPFPLTITPANGRRSSKKSSPDR